MLLSTDKVNNYQERSNPFLLFFAKKDYKIFYYSLLSYSCIKRATLHVMLNLNVYLFIFIIKRDRVRYLLILLFSKGLN